MLRIARLRTMFVGAHVGSDSVRADHAMPVGLKMNGATARATFHPHSQPSSIGPCKVVRTTSVSSAYGRTIVVSAVR
jgi:hypothetical protein